MIDEFLLHFIEQGEFFLRIIIAGICGGIIGYERKHQMKEAGVRTHLIVAIGAALMMVVSKYGFSDTVEDLGKVDASRIASQIVSGVGFLGAGMIFVRNHIVNGLTTAAGMWATAGIGMAIGAGMYSVGIATAMTITLVQFIFHEHWRGLRAQSAELITMRGISTKEDVEDIFSMLSSQDIQVINAKMDKSKLGVVDLDIYAKFPIDYDKTELFKMFVENEKLTTVEY